MNRQMIAMFAAGTCLAGTLFAAGGKPVPVFSIGPEAERPTEVKQVTVGAEKKSLSADETLKQTLMLGDVSVDRTVAEVTGTGEAVCSMLLGGYGDFQSHPGRRDVWLKITGGRYRFVCGANDADNWDHGQVQNFTGNRYIEMTGGRADFVFGGNYNDGKDPSLAGNTVLQIGGTAVVGSAYGAHMSPHNGLTTYGTAEDPVSLKVRATSVLTTPDNILPDNNVAAGYLVGGGVYCRNQSARTTVNGDTAVDVCIAGGKGTFDKTLVGGHLMKGGGDRYIVTGTSSVTVDAPDVTFEKPIVGGGLFGGEKNTSATAAVTLKNGTFSGKITAGGSNANVTGTATLRLEGGTYTETAELLGGNAGSRLLEVAQDFDFSAVGGVSGFDGVKILSNATLTVGTVRPQWTWSGDTDGTLAFTLTTDEIARGYAVLGSADAMPAALTAAPTNAPKDWALRYEPVTKSLLYAPASKTVTVKEPDADADWADAFDRPCAFGDSVTLPENTQPATLTANAPLTVGNLTVAGDYTVAAPGLQADTMDVSGTFAAKAHIRYLRLSPEKPSSGEVPALAELILYRGSERVAWPRGTTVYQLNADGSRKEANWNENQAFPNNLIDGCYGSDGSSASVLINPSDGSTTTLSGDSYPAYNKWWPYYEGAGAKAVIELGAPVDFDGYLLWHGDHSPRSPQGWTLEVSADGKTWMTADTRRNQPQAANVAYNNGIPFPMDIGTHVSARTLNLSGTLDLTKGGSVTAETFSAAGCVQALRFVPDPAKTEPAVAELILYRGGQPVAWPLGTTVCQTNADGGERLEADWTKNEQYPNNLIDGCYGKDGDPIVTNTETGVQSTLPNVAKGNNKWWPVGKRGMRVTVELGAPVDFDGYLLWHGDHSPRSPQAWTLEAKIDGQWVTLDTQSNQPQESNVAYNGGNPYPVKLSVYPVLKVSPDALLTVTGEVTGIPRTVLPEGCVSVPLMKTAQAGLRFALPEGYVQTYKNGIYYAVKASLTKTLSATVGTAKRWEAVTWSDGAGTGGIALRDVLLLPSVESLTVTGTDGAAMEDLPAGFAPIGKLTLSGVELKFAEAAAKGQIVIGPNATLDINGAHVVCKIDLAGGTLTNRASGNYNGGWHQLFDVSLSADSTWAVQEGSNMASIDSNYATHWIYLNGHTLTKTGAGELALRAGWVDGGTAEDGTHGTLYVKEGTVSQTHENKGDVRLKNLTLHIGSGATFADADGCWIRLSGDIAVETDEGVSFSAKFNWGHVSETEKVTSFTKRGKGTFCLPKCEVLDNNDTMYTCDTVIEAGTMAFGSNTAVQIPGIVVVKSGAAVGTCGAQDIIVPTLTLEDGAAVDVTGPRCIAANALNLGKALTVKLPENPTLPLRVVRTGADVAQPTSTAVTAGGLSDVFVRYMVQDQNNGLWLCRMPVSAAEGVETAVNVLPPTLKQALQHAAFAAGKEGVTVATVTGTTGGQLIAPEKLPDVLQCFDGEALGTLDEAGKLSVAYDFGIVGMTCTDADTVRVTAEVRASEAEPLKFAPGVSVKLMADDAEIMAAEVLSVREGCAVIRAPLKDLIGKKLTVRAVKQP